MPLLPETKILIAEYGDANFTYGEDREGDRNLFDQIQKTKETLVAHIETHYTATPQA